MAAKLKNIYRATTEDEAVQALESFAADTWGLKYPAIWRHQWQEVIPFFAYPLEVRRIMCTTNAIESLHMQIRKVIKNPGHFPNDDAAIKLLWLALQKTGKCHGSLGAPRKTSLRFYSPSASLRTCDKALKFTNDFGHTKFLILPQYGTYHHPSRNHQLFSSNQIDQAVLEASCQQPQAKFNDLIYLCLPWRPCFTQY